MSNIKSLADDPKDFKHSEKEKQKTNKRLKKTGKRREKRKKERWWYQQVCHC